MTTGIPTRFEGCEYRSRLEAKWAAFFSLVGWKFQYEPFDLNGWIPDFVLVGKDQSTLVEVKPFTRFEEFAVDRAKILRALGPESDSEVLLLGCSVFTVLHDPEDVEPCAIPCLGWFLTGEPAGFNRRGQWGFMGIYQCWTDRITGTSGNNFVIPRLEHAVTLWNESGNMVKWFPKSPGKEAT
ncbi:MAG: hypothetical protein NTU93_00140 [Arthrobacter sp.]|nr:hypothetical protein [Arthrobacter sp.]